MQQRDTLTPLDARNSLLLDRDRSKTLSSDLSSSLSVSKTGFTSVAVVPADDNDGKDAYARRSASLPRYSGDRLSGSNSLAPSNPMFAAAGAPPRGGAFRPLTPNADGRERDLNPSRENLVMGAAPLGGGSGGGMRPQNFEVDLAAPELVQLTLFLIP